ncbi:AMP-dependent synthetase/ligase [Myceligenerans salitolerans]|uniref:Acyl-CoA synthetase n=1 Tax=Myceligenerans salitolerans TaxID=1230528 RepID=A0ABS3ICR4_9MICO|nr:AMP-dependent synthetase/ligase [Myceligenerans salitolerans]MBO0610825.1 long-chain fatty acid--CoA ligase [Myceligenerans salitolerans]
MNEVHAPQLVELPPTYNTNTLLTDRVTDDPAKHLMERPDGAGGWTPVTASEFDAQVVAVAKGLVARGVQPGDSVAIMSATRYEWALLDFAIWAAGAVTVPIYETSSAEQVEWICSDAKVTLVVTETAEHAETVSEVHDALGDLREILVIADGAVDTLVADGGDVEDAEIARRRTIAGLDDLATIIYTSGTTGRPKGVELSHRNFASLAVNAVKDNPEVFADGGRTLLFIPMAHVFARFIHVLAVAAGTTTGHWGDTTTLVDQLGSFKPTFILAVPRVFEKVYNTAEQTAAAGGKVKIFHWAARTGIAYSRALDTPSGPGLGLRVQHKIADTLVFSKLRARLGGQARYAVSGGGPLGERLGHFYRGLGINILEGYGLTESTAPISVNKPDAQKVGSVGLALPGCGMAIADDGEVLLKGHGVFAAYHNNAEATAESFTADGWFRTGDLGELDDRGFLTITGRKKEIIVTAGGKNVAPSVLEDRIRAHALVSQCVVVGDNKPFIGAMITLDAEGLPGWLKMHGKPAMSPDEARTDPDVLAALDQVVQRANAAVSKAESIRKYTVIPGDLTIENGYLTPKQSVRRAVVLKDFDPEVERLYADKNKDSLHLV